MTVRSHRTDPVLITDAPLSYADELVIRKRRYALMMGGRIPLMIAAVACISIPWLAVTLLVLSIPLPWIAVLIANDRLPRKTADPHRHRETRREVESSAHPVLGDPDDPTRP